MPRLAFRMAPAIALSSMLLASAAVPAGGPVEAGRTLRIDAGSARAGFELGATMHTVHGTTGDVKGTVSVVSASEGVGYALEGKITIAVAGLGTGNDRRDAKMRGESLDAGKHPEIVFLPKSLGKGAPDPSAPTRTLHTLSGELSIRGTAKSVAIPVSIEVEAGRIKVEGKLDVTWADYGVPDPSVLVLRVEPVAHTFFHVELVP